jgi:hypothetical protein
MIMTSIKPFTAMRSLLNHGRSLKRFYLRLVKLRRLYGIGRLQQAGRWHLPENENVLLIPPKRIQIHTNYGTDDEPRNRVFGNDIERNTVLAGDWDIGGIRFEELAAFKAIQQRILFAVAWRDTEYFRESLQDLLAGRVIWGCHNVAQLDAHFSYLDRLIDSIRRHGLVPQDQAQRIMGPDARRSGEIEVNIGRNGDFLFQDGRHRLAIAKVLGLPLVPVTVRVRHTEWQKLREFLFSMLNKSGCAASNGKLYQNPVHPDLRDIPAVHACEDRFAAMREKLAVRNGRLLDIGCNLGFFCRAFEAEGLDCIGVEYGEDIAYAADRLRVSDGRNYRIITGDILDAAVHDPILSQPVAVINALSIFHHFLKTRADYQRLRQFLNKLSPCQMFFEAHCPNEPHMKDAYANLDAGEFIEFIKANTRLSNAELIYTAPDGRNVYSLTP